MIKEFRDFILKGNMLDLAVGVIIGASFGKVITEFTGVILAFISAAIGKQEVGKLPVWRGVDVAPVINSFISLLIVGFALFIVVKAYTAAKKRFEAPVAAKDAPIPEDVKLLTEIRDLLKSQQGKA